MSPSQATASLAPGNTEDFIAAVSHEVRQPLAVIRGLTEMLLAGGADFSDDARNEMLKEVRHNAERLGRLVDELFEATRSEASSVVLRRTETDLGALVDHAVDDVKVCHPGLVVSVSLPPAGPKLWADPFKLEQVLANILENACTHGSPGGVRVAAALAPAKTGDVMEISVSDKGKGIAPADLARVTQKYYRSADAGQDGLGLGLWISKAIVEAHGGELMISSEPGEGTTVRFTIPLHERTPAGKLAGT